MSNSTSACEEPDGFSPSTTVKKKRSLPGHPDPDAEVIALSPRSLLATNRFVCEICNKGFQRDQNLQLHRRGHNLPWRLKQKASHEVKKKVYICPESTCIHHDPARALGDLTGIKKHFSRKHGEKKWKCDKCSKRYAVQSDWKAHQKTCGTREYRCDCGTLFSRRDSFITHRAFCDALAEENGRMSTHSRQEENQETPPPPSLDHHNSYLASFGDFASSFPTDFTSQDGSFVSKWGNEGNNIPSKWMHPGMKTDLSASTSKSPGLSLCLGMGPGPGPPCSFQEMMANMDASGPPLEFPSLDTVHKLPFPHSYDARMHASPSIGAMGMLSTLFSSPKHGCTRRDSTNGMLGALGYASFMNELDVSAMHSHTAHPSRLSTSMSNMMSGQENPSTGSYQHAAASSATALLQKAAQMGATASKPSLLQKFGIGMGESHEMSRQPSSWVGASSMYSSSNSRTKQGGDFNASHSKIVSRYEGSKEHINSSDTGRGHEVLKKSWSYRNLSVTQASLPLMGAGSEGSSSSSLPVPPPPVRASHRREHEGDTPMVDFLGVGGSRGSSGMVGLFSNCKKQDGKRAFPSE
ncbi:hypothetical protein GOP47_0015602 [Adiantum capillus-veneris]|uniref:C2H2-type domain-containing protein n=1 Tax=Adiantum capillus-veneris TaxID=13818 RepID=A0A9D4UKW9_ADICA|nr:hypothetical protein GOP47_0015602 [Adiantum capillus-veneris]